MALLYYTVYKASFNNSYTFFQGSDTWETSQLYLELFIENCKVETHVSQHNQYRGSGVKISFDRKQSH